MSRSIRRNSRNTGPAPLPDHATRPPRLAAFGPVLTLTRGAVSSAGGRAWAGRMAAAAVVGLALLVVSLVLLAQLAARVTGGEPGMPPGVPAQQAEEALPPASGRGR